MSGMRDVGVQSSKDEMLDVTTKDGVWQCLRAQGGQQAVWAWHCLSSWCVDVLLIQSICRDFRISDFTVSAMALLGYLSR